MEITKDVFSFKFVVNLHPKINKETGEFIKNRDGQVCYTYDIQYNKRNKIENGFKFRRKGTLKFSKPLSEEQKKKEEKRLSLQFNEEFYKEIQNFTKLNESDNEKKKVENNFEKLVNEYIGYICSNYSIKPSTKLKKIGIIKEYLLFEKEKSDCRKLENYLRLTKLNTVQRYNKELLELYYDSSLTVEKTKKIYSFKFKKENDFIIPKNTLISDISYEMINKMRIGIIEYCKHFTYKKDYIERVLNELKFFWIYAMEEHNELQLPRNKVVKLFNEKIVEIEKYKNVTNNDDKINDILPGGKDAEYYEVFEDRSDAASSNRAYCLSKKGVKKVLENLKIEVQLNNRRDDLILFMLLCFCGLRKGEICALQFSSFSVDLEKLIVTGTRSVVDVGYKDGKVKKRMGKTTAKSKNSQGRIICLPKYFVDVFRKYKYDCMDIVEAEGRKWDQNYNLFTLTDELFSPTILKKRVDKMCESVGLIAPKIHNFRHSFVSYLIQSKNVSLLTIAKLTGDDLGTITTTYAHAFKDDYKNAVEVLQNFLVDEKV